jgi:hypothetical protein
MCNGYAPMGDDTVNTDQDLESMLWLARQTSFMAGKEAERERIIKLLDGQCQCPVPDRYHPGPCTCQEFIALIKEDNK